MERLQKVIASSGLCSRRKAELLIVDGKVSVNGTITTTLGTKVSKKDQVLVNGIPLRHQPPIYYVLYKPEGCVSTTSDQFNRKTVLDYVTKEDNLYPVGRLDYDTSEILLLTNDGEFTNQMLHPKNDIEKEYEVTIRGFLRKETSKKINSGVYIDKIKTKKARIYQVDYNKEKETTKLNIIITEGKYHHIKKLFEKFEHDVIKLKRIRFGCVTLIGLKKGEYRLLKPHEYKLLINLANQANK